MKTKLFSVITIVLMLCGTMFGQPGQGQNTEKKQAPMVGQQGRDCDKEQGPNFTDEQKAKMKEIRMASYKEIKPLKNQLGELKAKEMTLTTADKPDMGAINSNIDEITKIENKIKKIKASGHQQIRALLTDEQKMWFDGHKGHKGGKGMGDKPRHGEEDFESSEGSPEGCQGGSPAHCKQACTKAQKS
jgi:Spy/CpxP family protein refolding chaperone